MKPFLLIDDQRQNPAIGKLLLEEYDELDTAQAIAANKTLKGLSSEIYVKAFTVTPGQAQVTKEEGVDYIKPIKEDEAVK